MSDLLIRRGGEGDIEAAIAVYRAANDARRSVEPTPAHHVERVRASLHQADALLMIAEEAGACVGMGLAMQSRSDDGAGPPVPGVCFISMIFVAPDRWGEGIGGRIVEALLGEAASRGFDHAQLWTHRDNRRAQRLYGRLGFRLTGREMLNDLGEPIIQYERACVLDASRENLVTAPDGTALWTTSDSDQNDALVVLLSNGGAGCCDYLAPLGRLLAGPERRIIRWEQRGVGRSGGDPDGPFSIDQCLADMETIREYAGVERWVVAGHSWGADLALIYALARPDRCAGLMCVAGGRLNNDREWHKAYDEGQKAGRETNPEFAFPPNLEANRQLNAEYKQYVQRPTLFREVTELNVPALFLYGTEDIRPVWPVAQIAALLPDAELALLPGADHYPYRTHPLEVRAHADPFLRRCGPEGARRD